MTSGQVHSERAVVTADGYKYLAVRHPDEIREEIDAGARYTHAGDRLEYDHAGWYADVDFPAYFDADQLYDLDADPHERENLADDPGFRTRLTDLRERLRRYSEDLPYEFGEFT